MPLTSDDDVPASLPTVLPAPPRMPSLVNHHHAVSMAAPRRPSLTLVVSNPNPSQTRATVPSLRLVSSEARPSLPPPPSLPPTGSTPYRRAA